MHNNFYGKFTLISSRDYTTGKKKKSAWFLSRSIIKTDMFDVKEWAWNVPAAEAHVHPGFGFQYLKGMRPEWEMINIECKLSGYLCLVFFNLYN